MADIIDTFISFNKKQLEKRKKKKKEGFKSPSDRVTGI